MIARTRGVGIDCAKKFLVVWFSWSDERLELPNTDKEAKRLAKLLLSQSPDIVTIEATNTYHRRAVRACAELGLAVLVAQPKRVRKLAQGLGIIAKNDRLDARMVGLYGLKCELPTTRLSSVEHEALRDLVVLRMQLAEERGKFQTLKTESTQREISSCCSHVIQALNRQIERLNKQIVSRIREDAVLCPKFNLLLTIKGIGETIAAILVTLLPELGTLTKTQICALVGVAPFDDESGTHKGKKSITGGRSRVRCALFMACQSANRYDPFFKSVYTRLLAAKKPKKLAITACMRKLAIIANQLIKSGKPYDPAVPLRLQQRVIPLALAA